MRFIVFLLSFAFVGGVSAEEAARVDYRALVLRVVQEYLLPRYQTLAQATAAQADAWRRFCQAPTAAGFERLRQGYHASADAWAAVQHVHFGPVSLAMRHERFSHWPERRNAVGRALGALLSSDDPAELDPARFAKTSVAVQGLPALERLLFDDAGDPQAELTSGANAQRRCAVGQAIAHNLAAMADEIVAEWPDLLTKLAEGSSDPIYFESIDQAANRLLTDLFSGFQIMGDYKLSPVLGPSAATAKPKQAEAWRSGRAARNLRINLDSMRAMYQSFAKDLPPDVAAPITQSLAQAQEAVAQLPDTLGEAAADEARRDAVKTALKAVRTARDTVAAQMPKPLNLSKGFNNLDGD